MFLINFIVIDRGNELKNSIKFFRNKRMMDFGLPSENAYKTKWAINIIVRGHKSRVAWLDRACRSGERPCARLFDVLHTRLSKVWKFVYKEESACTFGGVCRASSCPSECCAVVFRRDTRSVRNSCCFFPLPSSPASSASSHAAISLCYFWTIRRSML